MSNININDFLDENGIVNWARYKQAKRNAGEECYKCGGYISHHLITGRQMLCSSCNSLNANTGEVYSESLTRCPSCSHQQEIDTDYYTIFEEGLHCVSCNECGLDYDIETSVKYTYRSPKLNEKTDN
jgi:hypothetical protein